MVEKYALLWDLLHPIWWICDNNPRPFGHCNFWEWNRPHGRWINMWILPMRWAGFLRVYHMGFLLCLYLNWFELFGWRLICHVKWSLEVGLECFEVVGWSGWPPFEVADSSALNQFKQIQFNWNFGLNWFTLAWSGLNWFKLVWISVNVFKLAWVRWNVVQIAEICFMLVFYWFNLVSNYIRKSECKL